MLYGEKYPKKFYRQYCEYIRYMFEKGVLVTLGSNCHGPLYEDYRLGVQNALELVGFKVFDFSIPQFRRQEID